MSIDRIWELLTKKFNNEISLQELSELENLLRNNTDAFQQHEFLSGLGELPFKPLTDEAMRLRSICAIKAAGAMEENQDYEEKPFSTLSENLSYHNRKKKIWIGITLLVAISFLVILNWFPFDETNRTGRNHEKLVNEIKTSAGSKTTVNLPDGSVVVLNAGSVLSYNKEFGISSRQITLTGEAYFDIRKNLKMPLVVHAGTVDIWVKGTTFNVKAFPKDSTIEAALITGIIELVSQKDPERKILLKPFEKIVIRQTMGDDLLANPNKNFIPANNESVLLSKMKPDPRDNTYAETAWLHDKLVFRSESFKSLARSMERRYNVTIQFLDDQVGELMFTGSFAGESLQEALEALRSSVRFRYEIEGKTILISK